MWLRLRQIALVAAQLEPVEEDLRAILGVEVCYRDPGVAHFGLHNALFPVGNQFLEVVAPLREGTAGGRYLERRGGDGGYMVITQCDDHAPRRARVQELGVRVVYQFDVEGHYRCMQLHPKDTGGSFFEIDEQLGEGAHDADGPWHPAGPDWKPAQRLDVVSAITAAELQTDGDPAALAARWGEIADLDVGPGNTLTLDNATLRFVGAIDGRGEGLGAIDVAVADIEHVRDAARARGRLVADDQVLIGGLRVNLR